MEEKASLTNNNNGKSLKLYVYLVFFLIIFSSGGILDQRYFSFSQAIFIIMVIPTIFFVSFQKKHLALLIFPAILIIVNLINSSDTIINYLIFLTKFIFVFQFSLFCFQKNINIFKVLSNIIVGISIYSLFTYFLLDVYKLLPYVYEVVDTKKYKVFLGIHYHWQTTYWYNWLVSRNNSIFWEPGVFQIYLNLAIIYQLFIAKKANFFALIVLLFSMVTTFSTTGIILSLIICLVRLYQVKPKKLFMKYLKTIIFLIAIAGSLYVSQYVIDQKLNYATRSYDLREDNLTIGYQLFLEKPLVGWGFLNNSGYEEIAGIPNNSNGFISMLFHQGILGIIFHIIPVLILAKNFSKISFLFSIVFLVYFFISINTEPFVYTNLISLFTCLGILSISDKRRFVEWMNNFISKKRMNRRFKFVVK